MTMICEEFLFPNEYKPKIFLTSIIKWPWRLPGKKRDACLQSLSVKSLCFSLVFFFFSLCCQTESESWKKNKFSLCPISLCSDSLILKVWQQNFVQLFLCTDQNLCLLLLNSVHTYIFSSPCCVIPAPWWNTTSFSRISPQYFSCLFKFHFASQIFQLWPVLIMINKNETKQIKEQSETFPHLSSNLSPPSICSPFLLSP